MLLCLFQQLKYQHYDMDKNGMNQTRVAFPVNTIRRPHSMRPLSSFMLPKFWGCKSMTDGKCQKTFGK